MKVVFSGSIGRLPVGGHVWSQLQYLTGLRQLGYEVYYLEDRGAASWAYDCDADEITTNQDYPGASTVSLVRCQKDWMGIAGAEL